MSLICWIFGHRWMKQPTSTGWKLYRCARCYEITDEPIEPALPYIDAEGTQHGNWSDPAGDRLRTKGEK